MGSMFQNNRGVEHRTSAQSPNFAKAWVSPRTREVPPSWRSPRGVGEKSGTKEGPIHRKEREGEER